MQNAPLIVLNIEQQTYYKVSVHYIESRQCSPEVLDLALAKLSHSGEVPENFFELFTAVLLTMQVYLRTPRGSVKDEVLRDALRHLRFPDECIDDVSKVLHNHRDTLSLNYAEVKSLRSAPRRIQWCINLSMIDRYTREDVHVCLVFCCCCVQIVSLWINFTLCSGLTRLAQPSIVLHLQLKNGQYVTFEVPMAMFHRLRYSVACLLKEFQALENRAIMKK